MMRPKVRLGGAGTLLGWGTKRERERTDWMKRERERSDRVVSGYDSEASENDEIAIRLYFKRDLIEVKIIE